MRAIIVAKGDVEEGERYDHLLRPGDLVIIASYATYSEDEIAKYAPRLIFVDENNRIRSGSLATTASSSCVNPLRTVS